MAPFDYRHTIAFLLNKNEPDHRTPLRVIAREIVPRPLMIARDTRSSNLARRRHGLRRYSRPASGTAMRAAKPGTMLQQRSQHKHFPYGVPDPIIGVTKHKELHDGFVELYVHHSRTLPNGSRFVYGQWEQEQTVQSQCEKAVLAYWSGLGGRIVALGSRHRYHLFRILERSVGGDCCLVQWIGYPPCIPYVTWVHFTKHEVHGTC
ncbi:hypothetical protein HD806DRAFT_499641 [Xylariaceae sp. AK1471]|nr:hypothetical protein HD806DRAFT_499641 [Xylariaceae sp. AK1471]